MILSICELQMILLRRQTEHFQTVLGLAIQEHVEFVCANHHTLHPSVVLLMHRGLLDYEQTALAENLEAPNFLLLLVKNIELG